MPLVSAYFLVIPGWSAGPGPEPMNTGHSEVSAGLCSWLPGSRAVPEPRNDKYLGFLTASCAGRTRRGASH